MGFLAGIDPSGWADGKLQPGWTAWAPVGAMRVSVQTAETADLHSFVTAGVHQCTDCVGARVASETRTERTSYAHPIQPARCVCGHTPQSWLL